MIHRDGCYRHDGWEKRVLVNRSYGIGYPSFLFVQDVPFPIGSMGMVYLTTFG